MLVSALSSLAKAAAADAFFQTAVHTVQIHGGIGTTREYDIGLFFRKVKSWEFHCGDTDHHYETVMDKLVAEGVPEW